MTSSNETAAGAGHKLEDFIEDVSAPPLDPDDYYLMLQTASGRAAIPEHDHDAHWNSPHHYIGRFWVVAPRHGKPELVSYRLSFADAEHRPAGVMLPDIATEQYCWEKTAEEGQHLTPHQNQSVLNRASNSWPRGFVTYAVPEKTWIVTIASDLMDDEPTLEAVRQRFVISRAHLRVIGDEHLN